MENKEVNKEVNKEDNNENLIKAYAYVASLFLSTLEFMNKEDD